MNRLFKQVDQIQIRFNDIDLMGHVNNATIGEYFDLGRMNYMHRIFGGSVKIEQESLVIASIKTDFFVPILIENSVEVRTRIVELGGKSLKMEQLIVDSFGIKYAESYSVMVAISVESKRPISIPSLWRDWIKTLDIECVDKAV